MKHISTLNFFKTRFIEFVKYDYNQFKYPLVAVADLAIIVLKFMNKHELAFNIASHVFRTGWSGSDKLGLKVATFYFVEKPELGKIIIDGFQSNLPVLENTAKFFKNPTDMLNGIITILKSPTGNEKGALIINYSYYFPLFLQFFDVSKIAEEFNIILEPSWAGFCEANILSYTQFDFPVFLQTYEERDKIFIQALDSNIETIDVGPSWFINHKNFAPPSNTDTRDIDVIMVAAWAAFKRHNAFFKAIRAAIDINPDLNITLVGYPVDLTQEDILAFAHKQGVQDNITIHEWITPEEVSALQKRAKVNVLWSKFEGNNRAIIEGMFCDTPVIMRQGHNYGENYDFINLQTGQFANETTLSNVITQITQSSQPTSPRSYVMENRNCITGTQKMTDVLKVHELSEGRDWNSDLAIKINDLHGMGYLEPDLNDFTAGYQILKDSVKTQ